MIESGIDQKNNSIPVYNQTVPHTKLSSPLVRNRESESEGRR